MIHNIYICPKMNTFDEDKQLISNAIQYDRFRFIFDINTKLIDINSMKKYFKIFESNKTIIDKLVETCIILNDNNSIKISILKTFLNMIKKERPVRILN